MSTPPPPSPAELKATQDEQQGQINRLVEQLKAKLTASEFGKEWDKRKEEDDKKAKRDNKLLDDYEGYQPTARTGQKSEVNIAKEEANGLNAAINALALSIIALEFSWSLFKIEFKPLFVPRWVDKVNEAIGRLQDRRGWNNPEGDAERRLSRIEVRVGETSTRLDGTTRRLGETQTRLTNTNKRVNTLEQTVSQLKRRSNATRDSARQVARQANASPALAGTANHVAALDMRVRQLTAALE